MMGAVWLPTFFGRTVSLGVAPLMIGALFVIGHDAAHNSSTHVVFPFPIERIINNIMDHAAHHIDPAIPLYHLPKSQRLLEQSCEEHAAVIPWSPWQYLELCRVCKLYDFERHCWTDFEGNATSETALPGLAFQGGKASETTSALRSARTVNPNGRRSMVLMR